MSWSGYVENLLKNPFIADAAIVGHTSGQESCWASKPDGWLKDIKPEEVKVIISNDRNVLFSNGLTIAGRKFTVLRDALNQDGQNTMDVKMKTSEKEPDPFSLTIGKSAQCLVIARGEKDAPGGKINPPVYDMTAYLRKSNF